MGVENGRKDQFHGFEQGQVEAADQPFEDAVEILGVAAAGGQLQAE